MANLFSGYQGIFRSYSASANVECRVSFAVKSVSMIITISPKSATRGGPGFTLTVKDYHFTKTSKVKWDRGNITTTFFPATKQRVTTPESTLITVGKVTGKIPNPGPPCGI